MSIFDKITNLLGGTKITKVLGIDIGSSSIKIVQLSLKKGIAVLDTFGEISLSVYAGKPIGTSVLLPQEKLVEALKDLMKEAQVNATNVAIAIPLKSTLMFNLKLPKTIDKSKLAEVVKLEARKYIPVAISEVQLDWSIVPAFDKESKNSGFYEILVVAIHKETINNYISIAKTLDLKLLFLEVETFSTIRSVIKYEKNTTAIVDIGSSITKFYIIEQGIIKKSNIINIGSEKILSRFRGNDKVTNQNGHINGEATKLLRESINDIREIPMDLNRILEEVKKTILTFQKDTGRNISDVVFTGGGALFEGILPFVSEKLSANVTTADPFSKVSNPVFLDEPLREAGPEFAVAVGIALRGLRG